MHPPPQSPSPTVLDILNKTTSFLERKGIDKPKINAEWLLAEELNCSRLELYLQFSKKLPSHILDSLRPKVLRRANFEPLQYILGHTPFMDLSLLVSPSCLIPRPETEELVSLILDLLNPLPSPIHALDLGTGSGAIGLSLALHHPNLHATLVDASLDALSTAKLNAERNELNDKVSLLHSNWFSNVQGKFHIIASNPPYLTEDEWLCAQPEVKNFEPKSALVSPNQGLQDLEIILSKAQNFLLPGGFVALETGILHHPQLTSLAQNLGYAHSLSKRDLSGRPRFFFAFSH